MTIVTTNHEEYNINKMGVVFMRVITDQLVLLVIGFFGLNFTRDIDQIVIIFLTVLAISSYTNWIQKKWGYHLSSVIYIVLCSFLPDFLVFLPLILYLPVLNTYYWYLIISAVGIFALSSQITIFQLFYIIMESVVMIRMVFQTKEYHKLHNDYLELQDTSRQLSYVMKERNKEIITNQDTKIRLATLEERNRIAREIHDNVGHMLTRSILMVGALLSTVKKDDSIKAGLMGVKDTLDQAMTSIRNSVHDLHEEAIELGTEVEKLTKDFTFCTITLDYDMGDDIERKVKYCFLMIIKEALHNIEKHSNASRGKIIMREHPALYQLLIEDNGTKQEETAGEGIGISNMEKRVEQLSGTIRITREKGFHIFVMIPKERKEENECSNR